MNDKGRFSLTHYPLPKNAQGKTFFDKGPGYGRLRRALQQTIDDHTVGVLSGEPGVGKTTAIRNLIADLPKPDYQVLYLCNTSGSPLDLYRAIAGATQAVLADPAVELLFRSSRGVLRVASKILRVAMRVAHDKNQAFLDEHALETALAELGSAP